MLPLDLIGVGEVLTPALSAARTATRAVATTTRTVTRGALQWTAGKFAANGLNGAARTVRQASVLATRTVPRLPGQGAAWAVEKSIHGGVGKVFGKQSQIYESAVTWAERNGWKACFAGDVPMRTPTGHVSARDVREGDLLLSRDEFDPDGMIVAQRVEAVFERFAAITILGVRGKSIRTTAEHPFYVESQGWTACHELRAGDVIRLDDGWAAVEGVAETGLWEPVYNFRISDFHTYFVGYHEWGFSVWAHNQCEPRDVAKAVEEAVPGAAFKDKTTAKRVAAALNADDKPLAMKILRDEVKGVGPKKAEQVADSLLSQMQTNPRTYQTYTKHHEDGSVYIGRASGRGTPRENIARRERGGHDWTERGFRPAKLDQTSENSAAIRGREQMLKDHYDRLKINAEIDGGISPRNPNRQQYLDEAKRLFGDP